MKGNLVGAPLDSLQGSAQRYRTRLRGVGPSPRSGQFRRLSQFEHPEWLTLSRAEDHKASSVQSQNI